MNGYYGVIRKDNPTQSDVHIDQPLTNISIAYMQSPNDFVADKVFQVIPVDKQSNKYYVYSKNDFLRDEAQKRGDSEESAGSGYRLSNENYNSDVWAFHKDIGAQTAANSDAPINPERDATQFVTQRLLISRERQFATNFFGSGIWGTDTTPANLWSDFTNSTPLTDVRTAKRTIKTNTGIKPNAMVIGGEVYDILLEHPDIKENFKYTIGGITNLDKIAQAFDLKKIIVADTSYATNVEGGTAAYSAIMGKHALVCYIPDSPSPMQPSAGYIFAWTGYGGRNAYGVTISTLDVPLKKATRVEGELAYDMKVTGSDLGYFFASVVA